MDDLEFVRLCVKGDRHTWDEFLKRYSRLLYNYIYQVLNTKSYAFAEAHLQDIFQELFCSLIRDNFKKLRSFKAKNGCSLATWLRLVTVNFTIDYLRRLRPALSIDEETDEGFSLKELLKSQATPVPDALEGKEEITVLKECVGGLDEEERYFLELHFNQGLGTEVLQRILKISRAFADVRKSRIIGKLRDCFKAKGFLLDF